MSKVKYKFNHEGFKKMCALKNVTMEQIAKSQNIPMKQMKNLVYPKGKKPFVQFALIKRISDYFGSVPEAFMFEIYPSDYNDIFNDFVKLPDKEVDRRNCIEDSMLTMRTENGHSVIYANEYMNHSQMLKRVAECRKWAYNQGVK